MTEANTPKKILNKIAQFILLSPILLLMSPILIYWTIEGIRFKRRPQVKPPAFKPKISDLIERLSIDTIEAAELIYDPLDAVPRLPFGHENSCWVEFKSHLEVDDELWSFDAQIENEWGCVEYCEGYASFRFSTNEIGKCFFTRRSSVPRTNQHDV